MRLYLVHHAQAKREDEDPARPLTEQGWQDARRVARYGSELAGVQVRRIFHSGKLRAQQTASIWEDHLHDAQIAPADGLDPQADPKIWIERLAAETSDLMLVGHFPHLAGLATQLLCEHDGEVLAPFNGGITCLARNASGHWSLCWMLTPEIIIGESGR
jgi:phosphohistidine phosphatase